MKQTMGRLTFGAALAGIMLLGMGRTALAGVPVYPGSGTRVKHRRPRRHRRPSKPLPPMKWNSLEAGLANAKRSKKPLVVVFTMKNLKGPTVFNTRKLRDALGKSGAVTARVLRPVPPKAAPGASADEVKALREAYWKTLKEHLEIASKYGAVTYPTMVFLAPEGDVMGRLFGPSTQVLTATLRALPKTVKVHAARKAKAAAAKAAADAAKVSSVTRS